MDKSDPRIVAWDTCVFIDALGGQAKLKAAAQQILNDAREDRCKIVASWTVLAEFYWSRSKKGKRGDQEHRKIQSFLLRREFLMAQVDFNIARVAQQIRRLYDQIEPADSLHLATAAYLDAEVFLTRDGDKKDRRFTKLRGLERIEVRTKHNKLKTLRILTPREWNEELKENSFFDGYRIDAE